MALVAFDLVFIDMFCVHQISVFILFEPFCFPVALVTVFLRNFSISYDSVAVAFITGETVIENERVIESSGLIVYQSFFCVAMRTIIYLGIMLTLLKMADKTCAFSDSDMLSLDDLRVTACTL